jgi:hypothetical protein
MKRFKIFLLMVVFFIFISTNDSINAIQTLGINTENTNIKIKGLVLKYVLIDTAYELYQVNVQKLSVFSEQGYKNFGEDTHFHYLWLLNTYKNFNEEMKSNLKTIFEKGPHAWQLMNVTTKLEDSAKVEDIVKALNSSIKLHMKREVRTAIENLFPYFYSNFLKAYMAENNKTFECYINTLTAELEKDNVDVIDYIEQNAGISFKVKYKPVFYFTLRPIGAMGFNYKHMKISTLQRTCNSYRYLLSVPFHEYSHELFQTFTYSWKFRWIAEELKNDKGFKDAWLDGMDKTYDWIGWCEENLVEGFAKYLEFKYYNQLMSSTIYKYDYEFYQYLKGIQFDEHKISLEEACLNFYKNIVIEQLEVKSR